MFIDCDTCAMRGPDCADCVVPVLLGVPTGVPTATAGVRPELDRAERAALAVLAGSGLVPPLRLAPRPGDAADGPLVDEPVPGRAVPGRAATG